MVEDNPTDVFLVKEAIAAHGLDLQLNVVENGENAILIFDGIDSGKDVSAPHLVLLDINLPRTSGFGVLRRIRESRICANVPVVVMTSSAAPVDRAQSAALGANEYFQKPSGYDEFLKIGDVIRKLLD